MKVADMRDKNIIVPLAAKEQVLKSATEAAAMLLRIVMMCFPPHVQQMNLNTYSKIQPSLMPRQI